MPLERQESSVVYSKIREFARNFKAHFIVTGSYLGKIREKEYFLPAGDVELLTMTTLTFPEFLDAFHKRELYDSVDLYGGSDHALYDELKSYGELDFYVRSRLDYGLEVKRGTGRKYSVPLYLCGRISFDLGKEDIIW